MTAPDGEPVAVDTVKSFAGIYDMPALSTSVLRELQDITLRVDMTEDKNTNAVVEMSVKVSSVWKPEGALAEHAVSPPRSAPLRTSRRFFRAGALRAPPLYCCNPRRSQAGAPRMASLSGRGAFAACVP